MARTDYQRQLRTLRADVVEMGEVVLGRYDGALTALETKDEELARGVIEGDDEINETYLDLESDCIGLFALQQPVASDLRFVAASFKILTDLERIADLASNLAGYALDAERQRYPEVDIRHIGERARAMVADAIDAYDRGDAGIAREVALRDDDIDHLCETASGTVVEDLLRTNYGDESAAILEDTSRLLLTIRDLERVADHAVNVCARIVYMVEHDDELIY
ncbi:phosphate signaling complex protein PhoU [Natronomonas gomsonensis]|uniref:phosphate signaling complex protein PhoU n=1 Tax=Natronomonas gomsonensis TaxID=1046043 RepID=UPI0020CA5EF1|nr:phosphate signaling complex protein PhoU [Natronomonas gomsonensis]MCY4730721.1 phosphate signaling complex protein PhoU [Natronomonas gomsonensis]